MLESELGESWNLIGASLTHIKPEPGGSSCWCGLPGELSRNSDSAGFYSADSSSVLCLSETLFWRRSGPVQPVCVASRAQTGLKLLYEACWEQSTGNCPLKPTPAGSFLLFYTSSPWWKPAGCSPNFILPQTYFKHFGSMSKKRTDDLSAACLFRIGSAKDWCVLTFTSSTMIQSGFMYPMFCFSVSPDRINKENNIWLHKTTHLVSFY